MKKPKNKNVSITGLKDVVGTIHITQEPLSSLKQKHAPALRSKRKRVPTRTPKAMPPATLKLMPPSVQGGVNSNRYVIAGPVRKRKG